MMLLAEHLRIVLFAVLCIGFIFYLFIGIDSYKRDNKSKGNKMFFILCIVMSLWAIGYALMLISPNVRVANVWRIISAIGWCYFNPIWISFACSLKDIEGKSSNFNIQLLVYIVSTIFFISNIVYAPSKLVGIQAYGYVDNLYTSTPIGNVFNLYTGVLFLVGFVTIFLSVKNSKKNRVRKQQRIILSTSLISFILALISDMVLPHFGIMVFPAGIITISIGMYGMWYAINKHKFMSISPKLVSEYIFEGVNEPIFILGEDFLIKDCNEVSLNITGYIYNDLVANSVDTIINFRNFDFNTIMDIGNISNLEIDLFKENKEAIICELSATVIYDEYNDIIGIVILLHDVSGRKKLSELQSKYNIKLVETNLMLKKQIEERLLAEEKIRHFIYYDALTELSNRKKMMEDINILLRDKNEKFAVLFIDLDKFKSVNDTYGHEVGDLVLKNVALRLKGIIKSTDTVSRTGGDEFIIIQRKLKDYREAEELAVAALKELGAAFTYDTNLLFIGGSIGISIFPDHGDDADTLINKADLAMYEVKNSGGDGYAMYNEVMDANVIDSLKIKKDLKTAVENNEFVTYYQPIIDLKSMKVLKAECLIRWKREGRIIPPIEFIPIAKKYGEIVKIDNWILDNACQQCKKWHDLGLKDFSVSVNTSYKQLTQLNFVQLVMETLDKYSLEPKYLNLEITEDEAMVNPDLILKILTELKTYGVRIAMDDFGTGYSSLSYINKLPIDSLKIDRSLIINLEGNSKNLVIIKSIIAMAHGINIKVVAEGVETGMEFDMLKILQCDYVQGYLIGKPMDAAEFEHSFVLKEFQAMAE